MTNEYKNCDDELLNIELEIKKFNGIAQQHLCPMYDVEDDELINKECFHNKNPICKVSKSKLYVLRGLCEGHTWHADVFYTLKEQNHFVGLMSSRIIWSNGSWLLQNIHNNETIAKTEYDDYPFGLQKWRVFYQDHNERNCSDGEEEEFKTLFLHQQEYDI